MSFLKDFGLLKFNIRTMKPIPKTQPAIAGMEPRSAIAICFKYMNLRLCIIYDPICWISPFLIIQLLEKSFYTAWIPFMLSKSWCKSKTRRIRVFGEVVPISEVQFLETPKMKENNVKRSHTQCVKKWKNYAIKMCV